MTCVDRSFSREYLDVTWPTWFACYLIGSRLCTVQGGSLPRLLDISRISCLLIEYCVNISRILRWFLEYFVNFSDIAFIFRILRLFLGYLIHFSDIAVVSPVLRIFIGYCVQYILSCPIQRQNSGFFRLLNHARANFVFSRYRYFNQFRSDDSQK